MADPEQPGGASDRRDAPDRRSGEERRSAETPEQRRRRHRLQARLAALVERSPDMVVAADRSGKIFYYNDGASKSLGYTQEEILGRFVGTLYSSDDEAKRVMKAIRTESHGGVDRAESVRTTFVSKEGEAFPVAISGTIIRDANGHEDGSIGYAKDLREILHQEEMATLGQVAIGLSHEIRNPLAVVVNQIELLENELYDLAGERDCSVENERLDAMRREVTRIAQIVERLTKMGESDSDETIDYVGSATMIDLSEKRELRGDDRLRGLRILVADDDGGICASMKEILEACGCEVTTVQDGSSALAAIEAPEGRFDLVLSDVVMPEMDGYELYQALKTSHPGLPVLMMTAFHYDKDHIIKRSKVEGLEGVVFKKPVHPDRLRDAIAEATGRGGPDPS